jgi:hypothetical protein
MARHLVVALVLAGSGVSAGAVAMPVAVQETAPRWGYSFDGRWHGGWRAPGGWDAYRRPVRGEAMADYWRMREFEIADFARYALTAPPPAHRWIRYYDDAVLIDAEGRVVDSVAGVDWTANGGQVARAEPYRAGMYDGSGRFVGATRMAEAAPPSPPAIASAEPAQGVRFAPAGEVVQPLPQRRIAKRRTQVAAAPPPAPVVAAAPPVAYAPPAEIVQPVRHGAPYAPPAPVLAASCPQPVSHHGCNAHHAAHSGAPAVHYGAPVAPPPYVAGDWDGYTYDPRYDWDYGTPDGLPPVVYGPGSAFGPPPPPGQGYPGYSVAVGGRQYDSHGAGALRVEQIDGRTIHHYADGTTVTVTPGYYAGGYWYPPVTTTVMQVSRCGNCR